MYCAPMGSARQSPGTEKPLNATAMAWPRDEGIPDFLAIFCSDLETPIMSKHVKEVISGGVLIWLSICFCVAAGQSPPTNRQEQTFQAHILIEDSHAAIEKWVRSQPSERRGDHGRLRTVSRGVKIYFPIVATDYKSSVSGRINIAADLEIVSPNGKVIAFKKCCGAIGGDPRTPGLVVLNPVIDLTFDPDDPSGTYTARATVTDGSSTATARESFRVQTGAGTGKAAALQAEPRP